MYKLMLNIILIISLLLNSAGQGYALRPVAAANVINYSVIRKAYMTDDDSSLPAGINIDPKIRQSLLLLREMLSAKKDNPTIVITGIGGYIGSAVAEIALMIGFDVIGIDNLIRGRRTVVEGLKKVAKEFGRRLDFEEVDLTDKKNLTASLAKHKNKNVIGFAHLAAAAEVGESVNLPAFYMYNNIYGTKCFMDCMNQAGFRNGIKDLSGAFASSAAVYGMPDAIPIPEDAERKPINPYGFTKSYMEDFFNYLSAKLGFSISSFRFFNAGGASLSGEFGENHKPESHLIPLTVESLAQGKKRAIYGTNWDTEDGTCLRDYVNVQFIAMCLLLSIIAPGEFKQSAYNVGSGDSFSVKEIIEKTYKLMHPGASQEEVKNSWEPAAKRPGDPAVLQAEGSQLHDLLSKLGIKPGNMNDADAVIGQAVEYFKKDKPDEVLEEKPLPEIPEEEMRQKLIEALSDESIPADLRNAVLSELDRYMANAKLLLRKRYKRAHAKLTRRGIPTTVLTAKWKKLKTFQAKDRLLRSIELLNPQISETILVAIDRAA